MADMSAAHSLLLNEEALSALDAAQGAVFLYEWLRYLRKILPAAARPDLKAVQPKLSAQLRSRILTPPPKDSGSSGPGPPTRVLLGQCLALLYSVGDSSELYKTLNACHELLRGRDDSPSQLPTKLAAVSCLGSLYERLGRLVGPGFEESAQVLTKALRNAESQGRTEILLSLEKMISGLGSGGASVHKELYKAARAGLTDRVMSVRVAAANCLRSLGAEAPWLWQSELESVVALALKALDGSNYETRTAVARLLASLLAQAHQPPKRPNAVAVKALSLEEVHGLLAAGFLRGGSGFLKGNSGLAPGLPRELRIGVTMAYVETVRVLGSSWLERHCGPLIRLVLELAGTAGRAPGLGSLESVYIRRCVSFILRATLGRLLGEKSQANAVKDLGILIGEQMNAIDYSVEASMDRVLGPDILASQHLLVCALGELGALVQQLQSAVAPLFTEASGILEPVFSTLLHPCMATRLGGAWALRCVASSVPSLLTPLIDRCLSRLEHMKGSPEAISGYSLALGALLAASASTPLGLPSAKGRQVFGVAEDLLRTASQSSRLATGKTQAGWALLGALMGLGPPAVRQHLPRMLLLWKNAFPRSAKEAEEERQRGDAFTWSLTLEARGGALGAMEAFFVHCGELASDEVLRRVLGPLDAALGMLAHMGPISRAHGTALRAPLALLRRRLYGVLAVVSPKYYESCFGALLRELVAEVTLTEAAATAATATSLLPGLCHQAARALLGSWLADTDHSPIEEQLHPLHSGGCGALEHDASVVWRRWEGADVPAPMPLPVAAVDAALGVFAAVFPFVPPKHRLQMLDHFGECIRTTKAGPRQAAMQLNVFCALLAALKTLAEQKRTLEGEAVQRSAVNLIVGSLGAASPLLRCAGAEALGRLAQAVGDPNFVAGMAQFSFDKLKTCRDVVNRTGHSLALGCLHRYVGSLGSGQHLNTSVSILLALAQDSSSPLVQVWSLEALGLIADTGGPMFRGYVEPTLALCLSLLLGSPGWAADIGGCLGRLLSALITTVGPELGAPIAPTRDGFLTACALMGDHADPLVQAEGVACLQQLHLFAQRHVNLSSLVPQLVRMLKSPDLILRKASVCCLRQLVQREGREVREHAATLLPPPPASVAATGRPPAEPMLPETGLEGALFALLDTQTHPAIRADLKEALRSLVTALAPTMLTHWLGLVKDILAATSSGDLLSPAGDEKVVGDGGDGKDDDEEDDDDIQLAASAASVGPAYAIVSPRWPTRVFAVEMLQRLLSLCDSERAHLDLALAKELQLSAGSSDFLVLHLSDLIRMAFMAATSDSTQLRMSGLLCLQEVITKFRRVSEPEFPGHVILEQFQAQVGAALRPAFTPETPSHLTARACQVCSTWIGSGVARDLNDLRRVHQLLVSSLAKLKRGSASTQLYSESAGTLEQLAILKAWAEVYSVAQATAADKADDETSLLGLVHPELNALISHWLAALRDSALLSLGPEFGSQLPSDGGAYYSPDSADAVRVHYAASWPPLLLAAATWLAANDFHLPRPPPNAPDEAANSPARIAAAQKHGAPETRETRFHLILGTCLEALCNPRQLERTDGAVEACLRSLAALLSCPWARGHLMSDHLIAKEILNVLHRLILTRESLETQSLCLGVATSILTAAEEAAESDGPGFGGAEGGESGTLDPDSSLAYALAEVALCQLTRQIPGVNPAVVAGKSALVGGLRRWSRLPPEAQELITDAVGLLGRLAGLCSDEGRLTLLPTLLFLLLGVLREAGKIVYNPQGVPDRPPGLIPKPAAAALQAIRGLLGNPVKLGDRLHPHWVSIIQAATHKSLHMQCRPGSTERLDEAAELVGASVFLLGVPSLIGASTQLLKDSVALFTRCLDHENPIIVAKALQSLQSIFASSEPRLRVAFIQALAPGVVSKFRLTAQTDEAGVPLDEGTVAVVLEAVKTTEALLAAAKEDKRLPLVSMLVQVLVSHLGVSATPQCRKAWRRLEEASLGHLQALGPAYPGEFKAVFASFPELKPRLEAALQAKSVGAAPATRKGDAEPPTAAAQPAIKLTMDFSAFKAPS